MHHRSRQENKIPWAQIYYYGQFLLHEKGMVAVHVESKLTVLNLGLDDIVERCVWLSRVRLPKEGPDTGKRSMP